MQVGARHPHQQGVGISDEARQCRDPEPLAYSCNLRPGVRDPERNLRGTNLTLAGPIRNALHADDNPSDGVGHARAPCGQSITRYEDAAEQFRPLHTVKLERQDFAVVDDETRRAAWWERVCNVVSIAWGP